MENSSTGIIQSLGSSNFSGSLVLMIYFCVAVIVVERVLYLWNPRKPYESKKTGKKRALINL